MNLRKLVVVLLAGASFAAAAPAASAAAVRLSGFTYPSALTVNVSTPISPVQAGQYSGTLNGQSFFSYCLDLFQTLSFNTNYTYTAIPGSVALSATVNENLSRLAAGFLALVTDRTASAAFQIALWEIRYETSGTYNTANGSFTATGGSANPAALNLANAWLAGLGAHAPGTWVVNVLQHNTHQDLVHFTHIPLPGTALLLLSGLGFAGFAARRRARA